MANLKPEDVEVAQSLEKVLLKVGGHVTYKVVSILIIGAMFTSVIHAESTYNLSCRCWSSPIDSDVLWNLVLYNMTIVLLTTVIFFGLAGHCAASEDGVKGLLFVLQTVFFALFPAMIWSVARALSTRGFISTAATIGRLTLVLVVYGSCILVISFLLTYVRYRKSLSQNSAITVDPESVAEV